MNYKHILSILLLSFIALFSVITHAEQYNRDYRNNASGGVISATEKRMEALAQDERRRQLIRDVTVTADRRPGSADITLKKNYPIVPYDPNHPNVAQPKKPKSFKFTIPANVKVMANRLGRGLNYAALGLAVADLIGEGVDWVLDPENNSIRYKTDNQTNNSCYSIADTHRVSESKRYSIPVSIDEAINENGQSCLITLRYHHDSSDSTFTFRVPYDAVSDERQLSLDTIAQHIINNDTVNNHYHDAVTDTITEQIDKDMHDDEIKNALDYLNSTSDESQTDEESEIDDDKTDSEFEFPEFCDWAKPVCDFIEWVKEEPKFENEKVQTQNIELKQPAEFDRQHINAGKQCPADVVKTFNTGFRTDEIRFEMLPICDFAHTYMRPVIIFLAYIFAIISIGNAFKVG